MPKNGNNKPQGRAARQPRSRKINPQDTYIIPSNQSRATD
jgi:hypothetical protein